MPLKFKRLLINNSILTKKSLSLFIIVGEESADNHGSNLIQSILKLDSDIQFNGIGGKKMIKEGLNSIEKLENLAVMGFVEVISRIIFFKKLMSKVLHHIETNKPDHIILIDYPGFNLRLAKKIKKKFNIPITYYISPQLWAWKENRIEIIKKYIDQILVIFPFEYKWYKERGVDAIFVGHPIYKQWKFSKKEILCKILNLDENHPIITLFPGSRMQEINRHLPALILAAKKLKAKNNNFQFIIGIAQHINIDDRLIPKWILLEKKYPQKALECADVAVVASGTSTIEAAVFGTPMVIIYKMSIFSWLISKLLIKVPYAGMVNIIAGSEIMPELLQNEVTPNKIYQHVIDIIDNPLKIKKMKCDLEEVKSLLKGKNTKSIAEYILNFK